MGKKMSEFTLTHFSILPPNYFSIDDHKSILQLLTLAAGETCTHVPQNLNYYAVYLW